MTPRLVILWMFMGVLAAFGLYMVKYKVQTLKAEVAVAEKQLREEKQNLHVLAAEWTYLNRPERIRQLAAKYLTTKPVQGEQLADFASVPYAGVEHGIEPAAAHEYAPRRLRPAKGMTLASGTFHAR